MWNQRWIWAQQGQSVWATTTRPTFCSRQELSLRRTPDQTGRGQTLQPSCVWFFNGNGRGGSFSFSFLFCFLQHSLSRFQHTVILILAKASFAFLIFTIPLTPSKSFWSAERLQRPQWDAQMQIVFVGLLLRDHRLRRRRRKKPAGKSNISLFRFSDVAEKKKSTFCCCWEVEWNECSFKVRERVFNGETDVGIRGQCRE